MSIIAATVAKVGANIIGGGMRRNKEVYNQTYNSEMKKYNALDRASASMTNMAQAKIANQQQQAQIGLNQQQAQASALVSAAAGGGSTSQVDALIQQTQMNKTRASNMANKQTNAQIKAYAQSIGNDMVAANKYASMDHTASLKEIIGSDIAQNFGVLDMQATDAWLNHGRYKEGTATSNFLSNGLGYNDISDAKLDDIF